MKWSVPYSLPKPTITENKSVYSCIVGQAFLACRAPRRTPCPARETRTKTDKPSQFHPYSSVFIRDSHSFAASPQHDGPQQAFGFRARMKALMNLPATCGASASTDRKSTRLNSSHL